MTMETPVSNPDMEAVYILIGCLIVSGLVIISILCYCTITACSKKILNRGYGVKRKYPETGNNGIPHSDTTMPFPADRYGIDNNTPQHNVTSDNFTPITQSNFTNNNESFKRKESRQQCAALTYDRAFETTHLSTFNGTLTFALKYDHDNSRLIVHIIKGSHLPAKDLCGSSDPYVRLQLLPDRKLYHKTQIHKKNLGIGATDYGFNLTVYDYDRFSRHDLIGHVIMRDIFERADLYVWTEFTKNIISNSSKNDFGDLLLVIDYNKVTESLDFTIVKAYNLRPMDITGASDPYVKINHIRENKRIAKKRTTTKMSDLNPIWNETLSFTVPEDSLKDVDFLIKVMDWDRTVVALSYVYTGDFVIGSDDLLGCLVIGSNSTTTYGKEHWQSAVEIENKPVGRWHSLLAEVPEQFKNFVK